MKRQAIFLTKNGRILIKSKSIVIDKACNEKNISIEKIAKGIGMDADQIRIVQDPEELINIVDKEDVLICSKMDKNDLFLSNAKTGEPVGRIHYKSKSTNNAIRYGIAGAVIVVVAILAVASM